MRPDISGKIRTIYPDKIKDIIIRYVVNDRELRPERPEGMTIIEAETLNTEYHKSVTIEDLNIT